MTDHEVLEVYRNLVPFLAQLCGPCCEVVLHDVSNPSCSVIAIENGFNSGRQIGSPLTDLAHAIIESGEYKDKDYLANYSGVSKKKNFVSSTYFIKNGGRLIGLLCINRDMSPMVELENTLNFLKSQYNLTLPDTEIQENFDTPVTTMLHNLVEKVIHDSGMTPKYMQMNDKIRIVQKLQEQGVLNMKGAVSEIASQLLISEPTVYRYLKTKVQ